MLCNILLVPILRSHFTAHPHDRRPRPPQGVVDVQILLHFLWVCGNITRIIKSPFHRSKSSIPMNSMLSNSTIHWPCKHEEHHGNTEEWNANTQPDRAAERSKESKKCWWNFLRRIVQDRNTFTIISVFIEAKSLCLCRSFLHRLNRYKRQTTQKSLSYEFTSSFGL